MQGLQNLTNILPRNLVKNAQTFLACGHNALLAQPRQMLRKRRLAQIDPFMDLSHAQLSVLHQAAENLQPLGIGKIRQNIRGFTDILLQRQRVLRQR